MREFIVCDSILPELSARVRLIPLEPVNGEPRTLADIDGVSGVFKYSIDETERIIRANACR